MNLFTLEQARAERAPNQLRNQIYAVRRRRQYTRRLLGGTFLVGILVSVASLAPRPAYAGLPGSVEKTLGEAVVEIKSWRNIRGQITAPSIARYSGVKSWRSHDKSQLLDDGVVRTFYVGHLGITILDAPRKENTVRSSTKPILDPRWNWRPARNSEYKGQPATLYEATGTFRALGKDNSIEIKIYTERKGGRLLYSENWGGDHTYASYFEYSYPKYSDSLFTISLPPDAKSVDLRKIRTDLVKTAKAAKPGVVAALADAGGMVFLLTKGGVAPDPIRAQSIVINKNIRALGMTYAFGLKAELPQLGPNVWFQVARPNESTKLPARATITYPTWKNGPKGSIPAGTATVHDFRIIPVPDLIGLIHPLRAKKLDSKWFR